METEIYYFSGTGNSFHVARELQRRLPGTVLLPIVSLLGKETITPSAERVGIVFPIHLQRKPWGTLANFGSLIDDVIINHYLQTF